MELNRQHDFVFKRVLNGKNSRDISARFLSLTLDQDIKPRELRSLSPEFDPAKYDGKSMRLDILWQRKVANEKMNVEMEIKAKTAFARRSLCYWSQAYIAGFKKGGSYTSLPKVISIIVTNSISGDKNDKFHEVFTLRNDRRQFSEVMEIHVLNLSKLRDISAVNIDELTPLECWGYYFKNTEGKAMATLIKREPVLGRAIEEENDFLSVDEEREAYQRWIDRADHDLAQAREDAATETEARVRAEMLQMLAQKDQEAAKAQREAETAQREKEAERRKSEELQRQLDELKRQSQAKPRDDNNSRGGWSR